MHTQNKSTAAGHTAGPWTQEEGKRQANIVAPVNQFANSELPGTVVVAYVPDWPCCRSESDANARLIASAPELLEALEALVACPDYRGISAHEMIAARAAIARAKGTA